MNRTKSPPAGAWGPRQEMRVRVQHRPTAHAAEEKTGIRQHWAQPAWAKRGLWAELARERVLALRTSRDFVSTICGSTISTQDSAQVGAQEILVERMDGEGDKDIPGRGQSWGKAQKQACVLTVSEGARRPSASGQSRGHRELSEVTEQERGKIRAVFSG